jgi:AraC family transcriptional regulator
MADEAQIEQLEAMIIATIRHVGPHTPTGTSSTWEDLILWASPRRLLGRGFDVRGVGLLWDDPRIFDNDERRYDVGIPIDREDADVVDGPAFITVTMPGEYLKVTHRGNYDRLMHTYDNAMPEAIRHNRVEMAAAPIIEMYRNSPSDVSEDDLITDIYVPIARV